MPLHLGSACIFNHTCSMFTGELSHVNSAGDPDSCCFLPRDPRKLCDDLLYTSFGIRGILRLNYPIPDSWRLCRLFFLLPLPLPRAMIAETWTGLGKHRGKQNRPALFHVVVHELMTTVAALHVASMSPHFKSSPPPPPLCVCVCVCVCV